MNGLLKNFTDWIKEPYSDDMTVLDWFLFVGLLLLIIWVWSRILRKVID